MARSRPPRPPGPYGDVTGPLAESLQYSEGVNGPRASAEWIVEDIQAPPEFVLPIAVMANKIPRVGDSYRFMPGLLVTNVSARLAPSCNQKAIVTVEWGTPSGDGDTVIIPAGEDVSPAQIEVSSTLQTDVTRFDAKGVPLVVQQDFEFFVDDGSSQASKTISEWKEIQFERPVHVVRFTRMERNSPGLIARRFLGHLNDTTIFGDQPGMWLCTRLDGTSSDGGTTYRVTYEFQRGSELDPIVNGKHVFVELANQNLTAWGGVIQLDGPFLLDEDLVSSELIVGEGLKGVKLYPSVDFREIPGLPFGPVEP